MSDNFAGAANAAGAPSVCAPTASALPSTMSRRVMMGARGCTTGGVSTFFDVDADVDDVDAHMARNVARDAVAETTMVDDDDGGGDGGGGDDDDDDARDTDASHGRMDKKALNVGYVNPIP